MRQLALDLGLPAAPPATVVSRCNENAYALLARWPQWPHPVVLVSGPPGAGKSHLAARFAEEKGANAVAGQDLTGDMAIGLSSGPVVVDDADRAHDRALFHLINSVRNAGTTMLLTATRRHAGRLADLDSRLRAVPDVPLDPPDDALLRQVMIDAFVQRQLAVEPAVVSFLMTRMERTLHDAIGWVERLDRAGLAERRAPSRPLAARLMRAQGGSL